MEEQLKIIQDMLAKTRQNVAHNGIYFIMWGWLVLAASLGQSLFIYIDRMEWIGLTWFTLMIGGGIASIAMGVRSKKNTGVVTYADQTIGSLWMACGLAVFLIAFAGMPLGVISIQGLNPVIMIIIWIGVLVTGRVIEWKVLQLSALLWFAGAVVCMLIHWHYHGLVTVAVLIPGYLIPGYILRKRFKSTVDG